MAIIPAPDPIASFELLRTYVADVELDAQDRSSLLPHKVHQIELQDLLAGRGFEAAQLVAWRYVFRGKDLQYYVAEIRVEEATGAYAFSQINSGRHVDNFVRQYEQMRQDRTVQEKDYELSILRSPACYVLADWCKGVGHDHAFLVPLAPVHSNFEAGRSYETNAFMEVLRTTARAMERHPSVPMPPAAQGMAGSPSVPRPAATNDDAFIRIEGIGPQIAALLQSNGIRTFAQLAGKTKDQLLAQLRQAGSRYNRADPSTWPAQAALAAAGKWQELENLQQQLKRGRSVDPATTEVPDDSATDSGQTAESSVIGKGVVTGINKPGDARFAAFSVQIGDRIETSQFTPNNDVAAYPDVGIVVGGKYPLLMLTQPANNAQAFFVLKVEDATFQDALRSTTALVGEIGPTNQPITQGDTFQLRKQATQQGALAVTLIIYRDTSAIAMFSFVVAGS